MNMRPRILGLALLTLLLAGSAAAQDFTKYHNYGELTALAQGLAQAQPRLVKLESIGKTLEKRDIWMLRLANPDGVPLSERPALLIAANFEADHLIGSELALFAADYLAKAYASNPAVKQRLDSAVIYILPRVNPDGAEGMWAPVKWARRTNARPYDDDNDGRVDEDGPQDLNKDGLITVMRVKDPSGTYMIDPEEPRLMKKADPKKGERGEYALYWEGMDRDKDGFIGEDGPGGVNLNRNFMHEYAYFKPEAGRNMVSEAETRAVLEFMIAHRNIAAVLAFGESDNLIAAPAAGGTLAAARTLDLADAAAASVAGASKTGMMAGSLASMLGGRGGRGGGEMMISEDMLREIMAAGGGQFMFGGGGGARGGQAAQPLSARAQQPQRAAATTINTADVEYFRSVGAKYAELTGLRVPPPVVKPEGAFFQYGYFQFGVPSFSTPGWGLTEPARGQGGAAGLGAGGAPGGGQMAPGGQMTAMGGQRTGMTGQRGAGGGAASSEAQAVDKAVLQWMDREKVEGFAAWTKFAHPDLGEVEIGGFKPYAAVNPPAAKIAELGKSHAEFALYLASLFPRLGIAKLEASGYGSGLYRVRAEVENSGFWPTALAHAVTARAVKAALVQLQVPPESIISGNAKSNSVQALNGSGGRMKFEWLIQAKPGDTVELKVLSQKAGSARRSVVLK